MLQWRSIRYSFLWAAVLAVTISFVVTGVFGSSVNSTAPNYGLEYYSFMIYVVPVVFFVVFIISFYLLTRRIIMYMSILADGLGIISQGNFHYRVPISRKDELGEVAASMNAMAEQLESQKVKERENEASKMELIIGVSHDLRTPLTSLIGYLDLLRKRSFQDKSEYERFVNNAYSKGEQLKKLIDDLFIYTRLSAGHMKLTRQEVDMRGLTEQVLFEFVPIAEENDSVIRQHIRVLRAPVNIDSEQVVRIIDNLLMNALKYSTPPKMIDVTLSRDESWVYLTIENEGECITKEQEAKLFERFYKTEQAMQNRHVQVGAGLGLAVARQLSELMDGRLTLVHVSGHYAFTLQLPISYDEVYEKFGVN
ncbi:HAMP domain-containing sensor histidine kinase [Paenibacillus daejeonensis]|uniref:HAMP domain-containing sensor histidine kinase n=1 Tax=Paenibacillus daejeonensis TaxID=135193 RepID=UPI001FDFC365|nr:HAMP domain-containing sensor histidine kinase [Paenibacillus daejeonensis]